MTAKELKASILQLAVTGKLVPQDPNDEPASVLLERIKAEKAKLVKAGKIKKDKNPSEIVVGSDGAVYEKFSSGDDFNAETQRRREGGRVSSRAVDVPFEIPRTWLWVRVGDVFSMQAGKYISAAKLHPQSGDYAFPCYGGNGIRGFLQHFSHEGEHAIVGRQGALCGNLNLAAGKFYATEHAVVVDTYCGTDAHFAYWFLKAMNLNQYATATAQPGLSVKVVLDSLFPLPPLAEQKRIVAKIEKLMPFVEEYGKMEETRIQLDANLPVALEKSILQESIQGKLVPQDPNDEPANELLKRIAAERKALVKAGKLKASKGESVIFRGSDRLAYETRNGETVCIQDEIPFDIPDSWEWVRLGNITTFLHRGKSPTYVPHSNCPMFAQKCNQWDGIHLGKCKFCDEAKYKSFQDEYHLRDYDIVVNSTGTGTLGRVGIFYDSELVKYGFSSTVPDSHVTVVRTSLHDLSQYIYQYLRTKFCWEWMNNNADGSTKQKELYTSTLASLLIPIPPLAEQRRIISAIPLLLNNCNQLKQQSTM